MYGITIAYGLWHFFTSLFHKTTKHQHIHILIFTDILHVQVQSLHLTNLNISHNAAVTIQVLDNYHTQKRYFNNTDIAVQKLLCQKRLFVLISASGPI